MKSKKAASIPEDNSIHDEELPECWEIKKLRDITKNVLTVKPESEPERIFGYVDISSINNETNQIVDFKKIRGEDAPSRARQSIQPNDVLFSNVRTYLRNIAIVPDGLDVQVCSTGFTVLRSNGSIDPKFLFYYTLTNDFINGVTPQQTGSQYPATTDRVVKDASIPLPPLAEQQRIVARVEALLSHVNAARDRLSRVPLIMKKFRQAVLAAACSGRLTEGWRAGNPDVDCGAELLNKILKERRVISENYQFAKNIKRKYREPLAPSSLDSSVIPDTWQWATFDQITSLITKGSSPSWQGFDYLDTGIQFVRSQNIQWGNLNLDEIAYLSPKYNEIHQSSIIRENDILLNLVGASIGRSTIATKTIDGANCNQAVGIIRLVDEFLSKKFILFYLLSPHSQDYIHDTKSDSARANFNLDDVRPTPVPIPPLAEQHEIVRRVGLLFERADAFDQEVVAASRRCERLTQAVLGKAFKGELISHEIKTDHD